MNYRNPHLLKLARNAPCQFNLDGCDGGGETSVWVHSDFITHGKGRGIKAHDYFGAIGCAPCHAELPNLDSTHRVVVMLESMARTWAWLWEQGLIQVTGKRAPKEPIYQRLPKILPRANA